MNSLIIDMRCMYLVVKGAVLKVYQGGRAVGHSIDHTSGHTQHFILSCSHLNTYEVIQKVCV